MNDHLYDLELLIAKLLRYGVILAGVLLLVGWCTHLEFSANPLEGFRLYHQEPLVNSVRAAWVDHKWGILISYAGLIGLIALPFMRVVMTSVLFFKRRETLLALAAAFVCLALVTSILLGFEI